MPTTAGTGSDVSGGAVITNPATHTKAGIANPLLRAQHALVDPELTYGLPPGPTAHSGIDALAQAMAAVVVKVRTPIGNAVGLEATRLAAQALPAVVRDGSDNPLPHGLTMGLVLAETMDEDRHAVPILETGFPTLRSVGVTETDLDELADAALAGYFISVAPSRGRKADVIAAYGAALSIEGRSADA